MDLMKLLGKKLKKTTTLGSRVEPAPPQADLFLKSLASCLESDLRELCESSILENEARQSLKVTKGFFEPERFRYQSGHEQVDYLFLQIPGRPGFLLQKSEHHLITLERATRIIPRVLDFTGQVVHKTLFVSQKTRLEEFSLLDAETIRTSGGKTLSLTQVSEMLLCLAIEEIEENADIAKGAAPETSAPFGPG